MPQDESALKTLRKKCVVYIDGFNLFKAVLAHYPAWKWLNIQSFFEAMCADDEVTAVNFFTARLLTKPGPNPSAERQTAYLAALGSLEKVTTHFGEYRLRTVCCGADCKRSYSVPEEKKTDVNMAVKIMDDVIGGRVEHVVIVSGDSDLEPVVEWIHKKKLGIKITVYIPSRPEEGRKRFNTNYANIGAYCYILPLDTIGDHLLRNPVVIKKRKINRPDDWV
jgi:hypothetical protein